MADEAAPALVRAPLGDHVGAYPPALSKDGKYVRQAASVCPPCINSHTRGWAPLPGCCFYVPATTCVW
jgi:hypothetical protein